MNRFRVHPSSFLVVFCVTFASAKASNTAMALHLRGSDSDDLSDMAEINVTPLVDVMLVLLIIFMITAPMLTQGLSVQLPTAEGRSLELASNQPAKITIMPSGAVYVDGSPAGSTNLEATLGPMLRARKVKRALLEADKAVPY